MKFNIFIWLSTQGLAKIDMQDYNGGGGGGGGEGGGSPSSPEMQHCSSTTQPLGTPEVKEKTLNYIIYLYTFI